MTHSPLIWAFVPFAVRDGQLRGETYDDENFKAELAVAFQSLSLPWIWQPVTHGNLESVVAQVARTGRRHEVTVFNFCDGIDDPRDTPGLSVVRTLERAGLAFTGADSDFYEISTSKIGMKRRFVEAGVTTPPFIVVPNDGPVPALEGGVGDAVPPWPLFCKPDVSAASFGVSLRSVVRSADELLACRESLKTGRFAQEFARATFLAEAFVQGPEFTVFVAGRWDRPASLWTLPPAERVFHDSIPPAERFLSYDRYWARYEEESAPPAGEPFYTYRPCADGLAARLADLATRAYRAARGHGYGRVDIRQEAASGELHVLEVNANCGLSGDDQTSVGSILGMAGRDFAWLLGRIVRDTRAQR